MKWFRFYDEALDDPKVQRLTPVLFKQWVNVLCLASRTTPRGTLPPTADIAFGLRIPEAKVPGVIAALVAAGLVDRLDDDTFRIHGWDRRQFVSDNVAERVARHRSKTLPATASKQDGNVPCNVTGNVPGNAPDTETDTETDTESPLPPQGGDGDAPSPVKESVHHERFAAFWDAYPSGHRKGKDAALRWWLRRKPSQALLDTMLAALAAQKAGYGWQRENGRYIPNPTTWLNGGRWADDIEAAPLPEGPKNLHVVGSDDPNFYLSDTWGRNRRTAPPKENDHAITR